MAKREFNVVNMDVLSEKRQLMSAIQLARGPWEVSMRQIKPRRSLDQNGYYFAAFVGPWLLWLREASGEPWISKEQAHEALKKHVLGTKPIVNKETGEVIDHMIPDSRFMDMKEFSEYLDRAAEFLASFCGIVVLSSELYFEAPERGEKPRQKRKS